MLADVRAYVQRLHQRRAPAETGVGPAAPQQTARQKQLISPSGAQIAKKPLSPLRKVISRRMSENWNAIPHVTQFDEADISAVLALRKKYRGRRTRKKARADHDAVCVESGRRGAEEASRFSTPASTKPPRKLFTRNITTSASRWTPSRADRAGDPRRGQKEPAALSKELEELAKKARERKVSADELKGGTFTISNQGGIGGGHFTPIVNKPEVAILGLGRGAMKPVVREGQIEAAHDAAAGLSYDHRVIDGGTAARFIVDLVEALENFDEADVKL